MKKEISSETKKLAIYVLVNSAFFMILYFWVSYALQFMYMAAIYLLIGVGFGLYYLIYNRGFVAKDVTPDMLPNRMTLVEKQRFIEDAKRRAHQSRWVLTVIIPVVLTFLADMVYLFIFPSFEGMF